MDSWNSLLSPHLEVMLGTCYPRLDYAVACKLQDCWLGPGLQLGDRTARTSAGASRDVGNSACRPPDDIDPISIEIERTPLLLLCTACTSIWPLVPPCWRLDYF
jgi:hypothetical protein